MNDFVELGSSLEEGKEKASKEEIIKALKEIYDPEIPVNIYDLGLIYSLKIAENGDVDIDMTLTSPTCPVAGEMPYNVADRVRMVDGTGKVRVKLVWNPPWDLELVSEETRLILDIL